MKAHPRLTCKVACCSNITLTYFGLDTNGLLKISDMKLVQVRCSRVPPVAVPVALPNPSLRRR